MDDMVDMTCQCCHRYHIEVYATVLYGCNAVRVNKVKL